LPPNSARERRAPTVNAIGGTGMEIPKDKVLDLIKEQGKSDQVDQAKQELPDQVDPERDSGLLQKFGVEPQDVMSKLGGGLGL
jgi:predicted Rdx family selenoprotein